MAYEELINEIEGAGASGVYEKLYYRLLKDRIIYVNEDVTDEWIDKVSMEIVIKNMEEKDTPAEELKPITIYLNSYGGSIDTCVHLIQVIESSRIPIHIRVLAIAASAGLYITMAGHYREAYKNSIFLLHKGSTTITGNTAAAEDAMEFYRGPVNDILEDLILRKTKITKEELKQIRRNETYCLGERALKYGFIDALI